MSFSVELVRLLLFCVQQFGIVLAVGAQTVMLISFLIATRDGVVDQKEERFSHALLFALKLGLISIIASGILITLLHLSLGEYGVVETPAFLFKWLLIGIIVAVTYRIARAPFAHFFWEGILGAHWYALFVLHVLAPLTTWVDLLILYGLWSVGFMLAWVSLVYSMRAKKERLPAPHGKDIAPEPMPIIKKETPPQPPPATPKAPEPVVLQKPQALPPPPLPAVVTTVAASTPPMPPPVKPVEPPPPPVQPAIVPVPKKPLLERLEETIGLPTIRVMPRNEQDVDRQVRPSVVQFE